MKLSEVVVTYPCVLKFHQVSLKSDEKQKSFIKSLFFCSEYQSVSRIVKIVHSAYIYYQYFNNLKKILNASWVGGYHIGISHSVFFKPLKDS